jgi:hypothetical protein
LLCRSLGGFGFLEVAGRAADGFECDNRLDRLGRQPGNSRLWISKYPDLPIPRRQGGGAADSV